MANIGTFIDGAYSITYNAVDIGITEDGSELMLTNKAERIEKSDQYGDSILDYIYRGGEARLKVECKEYKPGSVVPFWPFGGGTLGYMRQATAPIGVRASDASKALVLTSTPNTPAAATPATLTATYCIVAPNQEGTLTYRASLRKVPLFFQLLPYDIVSPTAATVWFTMT